MNSSSTQREPWLDPKTLGERIARFQKLNNLTQERLALELDVPTTTVGRWINGRTTPNLGNFYRLARVLGVSMDELASAGTPSVTKPIFTSDQGKPILSLLRQPRGREEKLGLQIVQSLLREEKRDQVMKQYHFSKQVFWQYVERIASSDMLLVEADHIPRENTLAEELRKAFSLKICDVADVGDIGTLLKTVVLGALGAQEITSLAERSRVPLDVGFAGGFSCARVIMSLIQAESIPELYAMPIAVQSIENVVAQDANTLVGMLGFFTKGANVQVYGLPYASNARLKHEPHDIAYNATRRMLDRAKRVSIAFLGLGGDLNYFFYKIAQRSPEHDMFCGKTLYQLQQMGCVGDILYNLVTKEGPMPELQDCCDQMVCSIGLDGLQRLSKSHSHVIAVAAGRHKASVARLALEKRYINGLIVDSDLAQGILEVPGV